MTAKREKREKAEKVNKRIRSSNRGTGMDAIDWGEASPELIAQAVVAITNMKCAVQFGVTRNDGALVIRIVGDGDEPYNEYCRSTEDIDLHLQGIISDFEAARNDK
jgi:hypothetical protein